MIDKTKSRDIFVSDISFDAKEEDLIKLFSLCGTVRLVDMLTDATTGKFTGRAFIRMSNAAETKDAITTLDGTRLINRIISVTAAKAKPAVAEVEEVAEKKPKRRRESKGVKGGRIRN